MRASFEKIVARWAFYAFAVTLAVIGSLFWLDIPTARIFAANMSRFAPLGHDLASPILVFGELLMMTVLIAARLVFGHLPDLGKSVLVATVASLIAFAANEFLLKVFFGMPNPLSFLFDGAKHSFNFFHGTQQSSFPSGHMALAASFAAAVSRLHRKALFPLSVMLFLAGAILVIGDWHFISDVIAGIFFGGSAGLAAGELWTQHTERLDN
jgi:membrane-associated phospholipid phosphatase